MSSLSQVRLLLVSFGLSTVSPGGSKAWSRCVWQSMFDQRWLLCVVTLCYAMFDAVACDLCEKICFLNFECAEKHLEIIDLSTLTHTHTCM